MFVCEAFGCRSRPRLRALHLRRRLVVPLRSAGAFATSARPLCAASVRGLCARPLCIAVTFIQFGSFVTNASCFANSFFLFFSSRTRRVWPPRGPVPSEQPPAQGCTSWRLNSREATTWPCATGEVTVLSRPCTFVSFILALEDL